MPTVFPTYAPSAEPTALPTPMPSAFIQSFPAPTPPAPAEQQLSAEIVFVVALSGVVAVAVCCLTAIFCTIKVLRRRNVDKDPTLGKKVVSKASRRSTCSTSSSARKKSGHNSGLNTYNSHDFQNYDSVPAVFASQRSRHSQYNNNDQSDQSLPLVTSEYGPIARLARSYPTHKSDMSLEGKSKNSTGNSLEHRYPRSAIQTAGPSPNSTARVINVSDRFVHESDYGDMSSYQWSISESESESERRIEVVADGMLSRVDRVYETTNSKLE